MESGLFSVLPWLTMAVSANVGGWIADTFVSRGVSVTLVRKVSHLSLSLHNQRKPAFLIKHEYSFLHRDRKWSV